MRTTWRLLEAIAYGHAATLTMKRLSAFTVICLVVVTAGVFWLISGRFRNGSKLPDRASETEKQNTTDRTSSTPESTLGVHNQITRSDRDDPGKIRRAIESANVAINLWGKVVDQDERPIPDVRVSYTYSVEHGNDLGVAWSETEAKQGETVTDPDGSFAITGLKGHYLTIELLRKAGYFYRQKSTPIYNFYGDTPEGKFSPRREKPVLFTMVHRSSTEPLVHFEGGLRVRGDGTPGRWNLWQGESDPNGELAVVLRREPAVLERPGQAATWSADLQIIGGGIIEAPWDEDVRRAPESGYVATIAYPEAQQEQGCPIDRFT